jgi:hypothetical protein
MRRREFITLLGGVAAVWPLAARAQQPDRVLLPYAESDHEAQSWFAAFREALRTRAKARGVRFGRKAKANATSAKGGAIATASRRKSRRDWQKLETYAIPRSQD